MRYCLYKSYGFTGFILCKTYNTYTIHKYYKNSLKAELN